MPVNLSDGLVFTELQISEGLIFFQIIIGFVSKHAVNVYQLVVIV